MLGTEEVFIPLTIAKITAINDLANLESMMLKRWQPCQSDRCSKTYITFDGNCHSVTRRSLTLCKVQFYTQDPLKLLQPQTAQTFKLHHNKLVIESTLVQFQKGRKIIRYI